MKTQEYWVWRLVHQDGHFLIPRADPMVHEVMFDFIFKTKEDAIEALELWDAQEEAQEEGWVLCYETTAPTCKMLPDGTLKELS